MKKIIITAIIMAFTVIASAQDLTSSNYEFGAEGGVNLSTFPSNGVYNNTNQLGYTFGLWGRYNWGQFGFQPGAYLAGRNLKVTSNTLSNATNDATFTSIDVPLLFNYKLDAFVFGCRLYTGPLISFAFSRDQSYPPTENDFVDNNFVRLDYNTVNTAWVGGVGVDINRVTIDARYEGGLNKIAYASYQYSHTRMSVVQLTVGYRLFPF